MAFSWFSSIHYYVQNFSDNEWLLPFLRLTPWYLLFYLFIWIITSQFHFKHYSIFNLIGTTISSSVLLLWFLPCSPVVFLWGKYVPFSPHFHSILCTNDYVFNPPISSNDFPNAVCYHTIYIYAYIYGMIIYMYILFLPRELSPEPLIFLFYGLVPL